MYDEEEEYGEEHRSQDVEMTEADADENIAIITPSNDNQMDEDDPVLETPRQPEESPRESAGGRRDLNMSRFIPVPSESSFGSQQQQHQQQQQQTFSVPQFSLPVPNMIFTQPTVTNPAPPPTQYKSDSEANRRRALEIQQQRLPALTVSAMSDTSPRRSNPTRSARTPGPQGAEVGLLSLSSSKPQQVPTPLKVLRTNINPWSPDVRQKPKKHAMKIHVDEHTPKLLLHFETEQKLGKGSFGEVLLACNRTDGWNYAIKKIRYRNETDKQKCLNEVYLLAAMGTHPNIIRYHSAWVEEEDMTIYIQTEYCNKGSLKQYALQQSQYLSEADLLDIVRQVASGLDYLHEKKGVAHLDVKPENVLVVVDTQTTPNGGAPARPVYKLADFGLIANRQARTTTSDGLDASFDIEEGDSRYLPRELLEENFDVALLPRADIFALAMSVWELAVRQPLPRQGALWKDLRDLKPLIEFRNFEVDSRSGLTQSAAASISQWPLFALPEHLSPGFRDLLISMLHPDPMRRPTARKLLEHPMLNGTPLERGELQRMVEAQQNKIVSLKREIQFLSNKSKALKRRESFSGSLTMSMGGANSPPLFDSGLPSGFAPQVSESAIMEVLQQRLATSGAAGSVDLNQLASEIAGAIQHQIVQQTLTRSSSPAIPRSSSGGFHPVSKENMPPLARSGSAFPTEFAPPSLPSNQPSCGPQRIVLRRSSQTLANPFAGGFGQNQFAAPQHRPSSHLKRTVSDFGQM